MQTKTKYESITDLNSSIHDMFQHNYKLKSVHVTGEISNYRLRPKHQYFTLKDSHSQISAVIWAKTFQANVHFKLKNGMKVNVIGTVSSYAPRGEYQIMIWHIEPSGIGQLYVHLKQVQHKLAKEGLFDSLYKRPLKQFPKQIAVITSPSGAVIRDIIKTIRARYPIAQIILYPADVQGANATPSLVSRLNQVSQEHNCDEVIIGRGGGSLEDLWGFESAKLAYAIHNCTIPVVSSVGHGTDTTTADLVADKSVVTPTAAAEACTPIPLSDLLNNLLDYKHQMISLYQKILNNKTQQVRDLVQSPVIQNPNKMYQPDEQELDDLKHRLIASSNHIIEQKASKVMNLRYLLKSNSPVQIVQSKLQTLKLYREALIKNLQMQIQHKQGSIQELAGQLDQLSPLKRMAQGYSIITDTHNELVKDAKLLRPGDVVRLYMHNGKCKARILPGDE